jgi:hypothetical protein
MARVAPLATHNAMLALIEDRDAISAQMRAAKGARRRALAIRLERVQGQIDEIHAGAGDWPECNAEMSYGVPTPCGTRVSHYMSKIGGEWVRSDV